MTPLMFIDQIDTKKHIMLVSDDKKASREIEFRFIKNGLENKEYCIYLTHGEPKNIEFDMIQYGIDVKDYEKKNLLHVRQIPNPIEDSESIIDGVNRILQQVLANQSIPFRIVGRLVPDVGMEEAISIQLYLEKIFHGIFETFNGSVMCTYDFEQIQTNDRWRYWLDSLERCHHIVVSSKNGQSVVRYS